MKKIVELDNNLEVILTPEMVEVLYQGKTITLKAQKKNKDIPDEGALCYVWDGEGKENYDHELNHTAIRQCKGHSNTQGIVYFYNEGESYAHSTWRYFQEITTKEKQ